MPVSSEIFSTCVDLKSGTELPKFNDGKPPINEPCYELSGLCAGSLAEVWSMESGSMEYVRSLSGTCCMKYGTCRFQYDLLHGVLSSDPAHYEGGCQSLNSSRKAWDKPENKDCTEQGECLAAYIQTSPEGGYATSANGESLMADVPADVLARIMNGSNWNGSACPVTQASGAGNMLPMLCTAIVCILVKFLS